MRHLISRIVLALAVPLFSGYANILLAQDNPAAARKQARASRMSSVSIKLDGRLDDEAWRTVWQQNRASSEP